MRVRYDLHIHSGLSPCAEKDMTPVTIVGYAKLNGLDMVAVSDHNAIANVEVALEAGRAYGVTVVPAMELQTSEDIHILCLFETFEALRGFYEMLEFQQIDNRPEIFGEQLIFDEDDQIVGRERRLLLASSTLSSEQVPGLVAVFGGAAVPAHIDREANGMVQILGDVSGNFGAVELSTRAEAAEREAWAERFRILVDSDAHTLANIGLSSALDLPENSPRALLAYLRGKLRK